MAWVWFYRRAVTGSTHNQVSQGSTGLVSRGRARSPWVKTMWRGAGISPFMLGWSLGLLTGRSANLVRAGSHADTGRTGTAKAWGVGDDTSEGIGPGGKLDDSCLKLNRKVGKKKQGSGQKLAGRLVAKGRSESWKHTHKRPSVRSLQENKETNIFSRCLSSDV